MPKFFSFHFIVFYFLININIDNKNSLFLKIKLSKKSKIILKNYNNSHILLNQLSKDSLTFIFKLNNIKCMFEYPLQISVHSKIKFVKVFLSFFFFFMFEVDH